MLLRATLGTLFYDAIWKTFTKFFYCQVMSIIVWISVEWNWELSRTTWLRNETSVMMLKTINKTNKKGNDPRIDGLTVKGQKDWIFWGKYFKLLNLINKTWDYFDLVQNICWCLSHWTFTEPKTFGPIFRR